MDDLNDFRLNESTTRPEEDFVMNPPVMPEEPVLKGFPIAPKRHDQEFQPQFNIWSVLFKAHRMKAIAEAEAAYQNAYKCWEKEFQNTMISNELMRREYRQAMDAYRNNVAVWDVKMAAYNKLNKKMCYQALAD